MSLNIETDLAKILEKIDSKIDKLDQKLDSKIDKLDQKIDKLEDKFEARFTKIDEQLLSIEKSQAKLEEKTEGLSKRMENQEFLSRGVLIGLIVAIAGGAAKLFGFVGNL
jgi:predicted  nucleic acid-binding Zn-ribbon protein